MHDFYRQTSVIGLSAHERTLLCSVISERLVDQPDADGEATAKKLRSLGTRLSCMEPPLGFTFCSPHSFTTGIRRR
jgi:hypothetical protein